VTEPVDVLVVGAGPTGLALATQLQRFGTRFRLIDRALDRVHESRALAIQPRTLEVLDAIGLADTLVHRGNPAFQLAMHGPNRTARAPLFDIGLEDTRYPFLLFLSQADTEAVLGDHLAERGATIERGVELSGLDLGPDHATCTLVHGGDRTERLDARYVVGCDGAHSSVRHLAGIGFIGAAYPQTFVLADLEADGLDPGAAHVYLASRGILFFFPLGRPASWRLLAMWPGAAGEPGTERPGLDLLQALADPHTGGAIRLHDPVWSAWFRLHHRHATRYRRGRVFLAGDAAHIHSPAGAQGMNTGIQDAWNLGWKLALGGTAHPHLLDTYEAERRPVGRDVLRFTDRAFAIATSDRPLIRTIRTRLAPELVRLALRSQRGRALAFRTLSQLAVSYRMSPVSQEGQPRLRRGPRAGARLPDAPVTADHGEPTTLHRALSAPSFHLLLSGPPTAWSAACPAIDARHAACIRTHHLVREPATGALHDASGAAHARLGLRAATAHHLVRPDGHIAYRAAGTNVEGLNAYLSRWLP
jgi:2-polyprenyl-6-methoxyphenol hydroxylase-like FAD-dependent oxidoreductase